MRQCSLLISHRPLIVRGVVLAGLILSVSSVRAEDDVLVIELSTIEYPSLFQQRETPGLGFGAARDITDAAFARVGVKVNYTFLPMIRSVESVINNRYPGNLGSVNWFLQNGHFEDVVSETLLYINFKLFYLKSRFPDALELPSLDAIKHYRVGNVRGSSTTPVVNELGLNIDWISTLELNFRKLKAGRVDFAISGEAAGWEQLEQLYPGEQERFATMPVPIHIVPISLVFHRDHQIYAVRFRKGLQEILRDGTYNRIMTRYYPREAERQAASR